ncbi:MAG: hypothetical protein WCC36_18820 [Gammaproteobacteria bacterium]
MRDLVIGWHQSTGKFEPSWNIGWWISTAAPIRQRVRPITGVGDTWTRGGLQAGKRAL